jgi:predicted nucleotidyltransferase
MGKRQHVKRLQNLVNPVKVPPEHTMASVIERILKEKLVIDVPVHAASNTKYETIMGSMAYGVSNDDSDWDIYGFCIPDKEIVFPHLTGEIQEFSTPNKRFGQWQQHAIVDSAKGLKYDMNIYNITKFMRLVMQNNPNMIDSLFTRDNLVISRSPMSDHIRANRKKLLHKGSWYRFKGYAYEQLEKARHKKPDPSSKRFESVQAHGYDTKFCYHIVRLLNEVEMIMTEGDLDLMTNREQLKSIRRGDWKFSEIEEHFIRKEAELETLYTNCKLPYGPDEAMVKQILLDCLEMQYGSLSFMPELSATKDRQTIVEIEQLLLKRRNG